MKSFSLLILLISSSLYSCQKRDKGKIQLIDLGMTENRTEENKGYGLARYYLLNLNNDSVYIQHKIEKDDSTNATLNLAWAGKIKGLSDNEKISEFTQNSKTTENGKIEKLFPSSGSLTEGVLSYISYDDGTNKRFYYFKTYKPNNHFSNTIDFILNLKNNTQLRKAKARINEDSIINPIFNNKKFTFVEAPPPPIKRTIKFNLPEAKQE